jgi:hypothetical protein
MNINKVKVLLNEILSECSNLPKIGVEDSVIQDTLNGIVKMQIVLEKLDTRADRFTAFRVNVLNWAQARGLLDNGDAKTQTLKTMSEVGELADNIAKGNLEGAKDDIGDILVTLVILCHLTDLDILDCAQHAWEEIKDRKGAMVNGTFVKD